MRYASPIKTVAQKVRDVKSSSTYKATLLTMKEAGCQEEGAYVVLYIVRAALILLVTFCLAFPAYYGAKLALAPTYEEVEIACYDVGGFMEEIKGLEDYWTCSGTR
jgi:hypothetical protein